MNELLLIDLGNMFWRKWFVMKSQVTTLLEIVNRVDFLATQYEYLVICADSPTNWRTAITAELDKELQYKAGRPRKEPEAILTLADTEDRLRELGYPVAKCDGYEADDVIAALVKQSTCQTFIQSDDKDLYQLISDRVTQLTNGGEMDVAACVRKFGVSPHHMRELLAMAGDSSDNIAGCPKVGPGKAAMLLKELGSIEAIKSASPVELGKLRGIGKTIVGSILEWDPTMALELVRLADDCPVDLKRLTAGYVSQKLDDEITFGDSAA